MSELSLGKLIVPIRTIDFTSLLDASKMPSLENDCEQRIREIFFVINLM